jgi:hypothetical protein
VPKVEFLFITDIFNLTVMIKVVWIKLNYKNSQLAKDFDSFEYYKRQIKMFVFLAELNY